LNYKEACDPFWGAIIKNMELNLINEVIKFDLVVINGETQADHTLEFRDYESLIWIEKSPETHDNYDFKSCDYYEFTAITFRDLHANSDDKWLKHYPLDYNIIIEIWESALLIKSNIVFVDGVSYEIQLSQIGIDRHL